MSEPHTSIVMATKESYRQERLVVGIHWSAFWKPQRGGFQLLRKNCTVQLYCITPVSLVFFIARSQTVCQKQSQPLPYYTAETGSEVSWLSPITQQSRESKSPNAFSLHCWAPSFNMQNAKEKEAKRGPKEPNARRLKDTFHSMVSAVTVSMTVLKSTLFLLTESFIMCF